MSRPETYERTIRAIDDKVETVLTLTATSTVASAAVSAIPGDTATPIAEKLADFTEYFLVVLCVLYAEKYLLAIIGAGVFRIVIPLVCAMLIFSLYRNRKVVQHLAWRIALIGICICITVPASIRVSDMIYETYRLSIDDTIASAEALSQDTAEFAEAEDESRIQSILTRLSESVTGLSERAAHILNRFVESLAVMIVTACVIPILVLLFFLWLVRIVTGVQIPPPAALTRLRPKKKRRPLDETHLTV